MTKGEAREAYIEIFDLPCMDYEKKQRWEAELQVYVGTVFSPVTPMPVKQYPVNALSVRVQRRRHRPEVIAADVEYWLEDQPPELGQRVILVSDPAYEHQWFFGFRVLGTADEE